MKAEASSLDQNPIGALRRLGCRLRSRFGTHDPIDATRRQVDDRTALCASCMEILSKLLPVRRTIVFLRSDVARPVEHD